MNGTPTLLHKPAPAVKSRVVYNDSDGICYETRAPLTFTRACQMAGMFSGNSRVLRALAVCHRDGQYRVRIYPNTLSQLYARAMVASRRKAAEEGADYNFIVAGNGTWECYNLLTGGHYRARRDSCSCPQWTMRLNKLGAPCKHIEEARRRGLFGEEKD